LDIENHRNSPHPIEVRKHGNGLWDKRTAHFLIFRILLEGASNQ
jgi:hypothetical protein